MKNGFRVKGKIYSESFKDIYLGNKETAESRIG
jgi:hypothetical protein